MINYKEHQTTNFSSLNFYKANRLINKNSVKDIVKSMEMYGNLSVGLVAMIKGISYIIDGQHRFTSCKELNIPFRYTLIELENTNEMVNLISSLNSSGKTWKDIDYLEAWAVEEKKAYTWIKECNDEFKTVTFSNLKNIFGWTPKAFKDGTWSISRKQYLRGTRIVRQLSAIIPIMYDNGKVNAQPMRAIIDAMKQDNYSHAKMVRSIVNGKGLWSSDETTLRTQLFQEISQY